MQLVIIIRQLLAGNVDGSLRKNDIATYIYDIVLSNSELLLTNCIVVSTLCYLLAFI
jgi:hypothetical protein